MGSNGKRDPVGQQIDAATEILARIEAEAERLDVTDGNMLHMVVLAWFDCLASDGLVRREDPRLDRITAAVAEMQAEAEFVRDHSEARRG